jgi:hypothetical protein
MKGLCCMAGQRPYLTQGDIHHIDNDDFEEVDLPEAPEKRCDRVPQITDFKQDTRTMQEHHELMLDCNKHKYA